MAAEVSSAKDKRKLFSCKLCDFSVDYHYFGSKPPFAKALKFLEECYVMKDPFSNTGGFIAIGGICSVCGANVCMANDCSLFYSKRFCLPCVLKHLEEFPTEIQQTIDQTLHFVCYKPYPKVKSAENEKGDGRLTEEREETED